jgi:hypothetical protein
MHLKEKTFGTFDFDCINDPEFKEDSVREDIIAPLLRSIGYGASGPHKLIRSKPLTHPYVLFGSQKRKISIVPDYLIAIDDKPCFVLDAKSPSEEITKGDNVAQVYSYAMHPEVRAWNYGLCNGRSLTLFEVTSIKPKHIYDLTKLNDTMLLDINQKLNPRTIKDNQILDYKLDGGTYLHFVMNAPLSMEFQFLDVLIPYLGVVNEDCYCINVAVTDMADCHLCFTFDFNRALLEKLLCQLSPVVAGNIRKSLREHPFVYENHVAPPSTHIHCKLTAKPQFARNGEMFYPMEVIDFPS